MLVGPAALVRASFKPRRLERAVGAWGRAMPPTDNHSAPQAPQAAPAGAFDVFDGVQPRLCLRARDGARRRGARRAPPAHRSARRVHLRRHRAGRDAVAGGRGHRRGDRAGRARAAGLALVDVLLCLVDGWGLRRCARTRSG